MLHVRAGLAAAAPAIWSFSEITGYALQSAGAETEQQSMLPALLLAAGALTVTILRIFYGRRLKNQDT